MNYPALTPTSMPTPPNNSSEVEPTCSTTFFRTLESFNKTMYRFYELPMLISETIINHVYELVVNHTVSCSMCVCGAITATVSVTSIAVGLGVGLGLGCLQTDSTNTTNT